MAQEVASIEKGLKMLATEESWSGWQVETSLPSASISTLIANTNLKNYVQRVNPPSGYYLYDNDGNPSCGKVRYYSTSNWVVYKMSGNQSL